MLLQASQNAAQSPGRSPASGPLRPSSMHYTAAGASRGRMWGTVLHVSTWAAALCWGCTLAHMDGEDSVTQILSLPGRPVTMPCPYHYEDRGEVPQLSVQWRGPPGRGLLCHYIKHKAFQNCSGGYGLSYRPGSILLTIRRVQAPDYGTHVCSVSKRHDVSDSSVLLAPRTEGVTGGRSNARLLPGPTRGLPLLPALLWIVCS